jgi:hypothetical protein
MPFDARPEIEIAKEGGAGIPRSMTARDLVVNARKYIANRKTWTWGSLARDAKRKRTDVSSVEAVAFCALGAIERSVYDLACLQRRYSNAEFHRLRNLSFDMISEMNAIADYLYGSSGLMRLNDNTGNSLLFSSSRKRVLKVFDAWLARHPEIY